MEFHNASIPSKIAINPPSSRSSIDKSRYSNKPADQAAYSVFKGINEKMDEFKNSKEYNILRNNFIKIAAKEFDTKIYSSTFESKDDSVREAFIEKRADELLNILLVSVDFKTSDSMILFLHKSWDDILDKIYHKDLDFNTVDSNHPFGISGLKEIKYKGKKIIFSEKSGKLSASVGNKTYTTNDLGIKGVLKLISKVSLIEFSPSRADTKTASQLHKLALEQLHNKRDDSSVLLQTVGGMISGLEVIAHRGEGFLLIAKAKYAGDKSAAGTNQTTTATNSEYSTPLTMEAAVGGSIGIAFGVFTVAAGIEDLAEAFNSGIEGEEFLKLYNEFQKNYNIANPKLSNTDIFQLEELNKVVELMKTRSKVMALSGDGVLKVLLGSANLILGSGSLAQVSTLAIAGTGLTGGLLIVSGSVEMDKACKKLQKLTRREEEAEVATLHALEEIETSAMNSKDKHYQAGLLKSFMEIQADMIENEETKEYLNFTHGSSMAMGGIALVAAAAAGVAGGATMGAIPVVILGSAAIGYTGGKAYLWYKDRKIEQMETKLLAQDIAQVKAAKEAGGTNPFKNMRSTAGKLMELYIAVKAEQVNTKPGQLTPLSTHIVQEFINIPPEAFLKLMKGMDKTFMNSIKDENIVGTGMFIKNEGLVNAAKNTAINKMNDTEIVGHKLKAKVAGGVGEKETKKTLLESAMKKEAKQEVKEELRILKVLERDKKHEIEEEGKIIKNQKTEIIHFAKKLEPAAKMLKVSIAEAGEAAKKSAVSNLKADYDVYKKINNAIYAANNALNEASKVILGNESSVWNENINAEFEAQAAANALEVEMADLKGLIDFVSRNTKIENRVDTYNHYQEQYAICKTLAKETLGVLDLLKGSVKARREIMRASNAIRDASLKLKKLEKESGKGKTDINQLIQKRVDQKIKERLSKNQGLKGKINRISDELSTPIILV